MVQTPFSSLHSTQQLPNTVPLCLALLRRHRAAERTAVPHRGQVDLCLKEKENVQKMPLKMMLQPPTCAPGEGEGCTCGERLPAPPACENTLSTPTQRGAALCCSPGFNLSPRLSTRMGGEGRDTILTP